MRRRSALEEASLPLRNVFGWVPPRRNSKVVNNFVVYLLVDVRSRCVATASPLSNVVGFIATMQRYDWQINVLCEEDFVFRIDFILYHVSNKGNFKCCFTLHCVVRSQNLR